MMWKDARNKTELTRLFYNQSLKVKTEFSYQLLLFGFVVERVQKCNSYSNRICSLKDSNACVHSESLLMKLPIIRSFRAMVCHQLLLI